MVQYLAKRIGRSLLTLFIIVTLVFCLLRLMPVEGYFANYEKMTAAQIQAGLQSMGLLDPLPVQIVFVTGYSDYIAEGYEVAALHYLMKPVSGEKLFAVLNRALEKRKREERCLNLELGGEMVRIPFYDIRYLDVRQNYVTIHAKAEYTVKRSLNEFEKELDDRFFRAGRSLIINLKYIRRVTKTEVSLSDGTLLPLPRGAYEPLNRAIIKHT